MLWQCCLLNVGRFIHLNSSLLYCMPLCHQGQYMYIVKEKGRMPYFVDNICKGQTLRFGIYIQNPRPTILYVLPSPLYFFLHITTDAMPPARTQHISYSQTLIAKAMKGENKQPLQILIVLPRVYLSRSRRPTFGNYSSHPAFEAYHGTRYYQWRP